MTATIERIHSSLPPAVEPTSSTHADIRAHFEELLRQQREEESALPAIRQQGKAALGRLLEIARGDSNQCRYVAHFLLGMYNGERFKFDLTDFRCLDSAIFEDCVLVLKMDRRPAQEVHAYFHNGGAIWEQMAKDWNVRDYSKRAAA